MSQLTIPLVVGVIQKKKKKKKKKKEKAGEFVDNITRKLDLTSTSHIKENSCHNKKLNPGSCSYQCVYINI